MSHTPGPWAIHDGGRFGSYGDIGPSICAEKSEFECQPLFEICGPADAAECEANANLVAAAPDLLAACKGFMEAIMTEQIARQRGFGPEWADAARAIAKAEGKQ